MEKKKRRKKLSQCSQENQGIKCRGKYILNYEKNIPIFICEKCGHKDNSWQKFYEDYLYLFKIKENWNQKKNYVSCLIGFFCHMYKEKYNIDYTFIPNNINPFSSKECSDAWKLLAAFDNDINNTRKYIYWVFKKALNNSTEITSFGYLNAPGLIRKYKLKISKENILTRYSKLPDEFLEWCRNNIPNLINNYNLVTINDLGSLLNYTKQFINDENSDEYRAIKKAEQFNLIKNWQLNIGENK